MQWKAAKSPENVADCAYKRGRYSQESYPLPISSSMSDSACTLQLDSSLKDASEIEFFNDVDDDVPMTTLAFSSHPLASSFSQAQLDSFLSTVASATVVAGSH